MRWMTKLARPDPDLNCPYGLPIACLLDFLQIFLSRRERLSLGQWTILNHYKYYKRENSQPYWRSIPFQDIIELEKGFWSLRNAAPTGQLDAESLTPLLSPPLPAAAVAGAFLAFDENRDGHVDFKELCCGLSAACRGPRTERLKCKYHAFAVSPLS